MTCPRCQSVIDSTGKLCPDCGARLFRNISGVMKTSAVMISFGGEESFYQSVQDVPELLRRRLVESTTGENSGTIVIADRAGKEQLTQVLGRRETTRGKTGSQDQVPIREALSHLAISEAAPEAAVADRSSLHWPIPPVWIAWAGFGFVLALAAVFAIFFSMRW